MSNVRQPACDGVAEGIGFAFDGLVLGAGAVAVEDDDDEEDGNGTGAIATAAGGGVSGGVVGIRTGTGMPDHVQHSTLHATTCNSTQCSTMSSQARMPQSMWVHGCSI